MCDFIMTEYSNLKDYKNLYKWHKYPDEQPKEFGQYLIAVKGKLHKYWYLVAQWDDEWCEEFYFYDQNAKIHKYENVVAWKEIEPYEVNE